MANTGTKRVIECEIWSRVVGYFRPVKDWNLGMQEQFRERKNMLGNRLYKTVPEQKKTM